MSEFHELPADDPKITLQIAVPDGRNGQICLATNLDQWVPQSTINQVLDKLMAVAERQRAKITLPEIRHELDGNLAVVKQGKVNLAAMDAAHKEKMRQLDEQHRDAKVAFDLTFDTAHREHEASGKAGDFKPRGTALQKLNRHTRAMTDAEAEKTKTENEYLRARSEQANDVQKREISVEILTRRLSELEAMVNGTDGEPDLRGSSQPS